MFSAKERNKVIEHLATQMFDVLIIGGGITGAGIALDAASRGLSVALVEMQDFAAGTSSRSTKLIHGGLRYLKQLEFKLVAEVGKEREIVHRNAPHLTKPAPMLLPIVDGGSFNRVTAQLGMFIYEWLAGVKKAERHKVLSVGDLRQIIPELQPKGLKSAILFYEYRTDDARLTIEVLKEAVAQGTWALNYAKVVALNYEQGKICGAKIKDEKENVEFFIKAKYVVNAGGPWVDGIDDMDNGSNRHKLHLTKGVHLVVDGKKLPIQQAVYFDTYDKRMLFAIPRQGKVYMGTTDTFYEEDLLYPQINQQECAYILRCVNEYFPDAKLQQSDVISGWAGLRPLVHNANKKPSEISRKDELFESSSGLITIAGGKLTGYRKMAQRVLDLIAQKMEKKQQKHIPFCKTEAIKIAGGRLPEGIEFKDFVNQKIKVGLELGLKETQIKNMIYRFGNQIDEIYNLMLLYNQKQAILPVWLKAECAYCIQNEMCTSLSDFLIRRTGMVYFDLENAILHKENLNYFMAEELGWKEEVRNQSLAHFNYELSLLKVN